MYFQIQKTTVFFFNLRIYQLFFFINVCAVINFQKSTEIISNYLGRLHIQMQFHRRRNVGVWYLRRINVEITSTIAIAFSFQISDLTEIDCYRRYLPQQKMKAGATVTSNSYFRSYISSISKSHQNLENSSIFHQFWSRINVNLSTLNWFHPFHVARLS